MAINNLANTKWQFKNEPALSDLGTFAVNFASNNTDYTSLTVTAERMKYGDDLAYGEPEPVYPVKGDLITMNIDGSDKQFRVLNANGSVAEVLMMTNASSSQQFAASGQIYAESALDTYLNSTWYATLNATAQAAIVDKTFTQDSWYWDASGDPDYSGYYGTTNPGTSAYTISLGSATFGASITRHVYALSVQDVLDYVLDTNITDGQLQNYNIWKMFWDITTQPPSTPQRVLWLRSADAASSSFAFGVLGDRGRVNSTNVGNSYAVRPAFTIDLSQIDFSISA